MQNEFHARTSQNSKKKCYLSVEITKRSHHPKNRWSALLWPKKNLAWQEIAQNLIAQITQGAEAPNNAFPSMII
jgi:hypothetical protein